jgi:peptidoglycan hydrolase-like protein with peptidoglycan-binding domain
VRRVVLLLSLAVALVAPARALAASTPSVVATPASGAAPLAVTLTASGGAEPYRWDLGDGTFADGATVQHTYAAGQWIATVTGADGASATVTIHAEAVSLQAPAKGTYGKRAVFTGAVVPATAPTTVTLETGGRQLATATTASDGTFRIALPKLAGPGPYVARTALAASTPAAVLVRPLLVTKTKGTPLAGGRIVFVARATPAAAGTVRLRVWRGERIVAQARGAGVARVALHPGEGTLRVTALTLPAQGWDAARVSATQVVLRPTLSVGASGPSVFVLKQRLAAMHYALRGVNGYYGADTADAVLAFQKVHGLARTGSVTASLWPRILDGTAPAARYGGDHVEVDKARQVLFEVRGGKVVLVVHVSTGATGNTPVGVWHVYRRVAGWDWVLYYPTYFLRGFAIHGYPSVPPYPASHGCVRVPLWAATTLYALNGFGTTVYVYA